MSFQKIEDVLIRNIDDILKLMNFDRFILQFAIEGIEDLQKSLKETHNIENPALLAENALQMLKQIQTNDSLRPKYEVIFNQCIVLLVSVFSSSVADLFREGICLLATKGDSKKLKNEELKISVSDLIEYDSGINERLGYLIADKNDFSFQDMKSISRAFKDYFDFNIEKNENVNTIILVQAGRHVIVHDSSRINERFIRQVSGAKPRKIKSDLNEGKINFDSNEVKVAAESMHAYFIQVRKQVEDRLEVSNQ